MESQNYDAQCVSMRNRLSTLGIIVLRACCRNKSGCNAGWQVIAECVLLLLDCAPQGISGILYAASSLFDVPDSLQVCDMVCTLPEKCVTC
jgi:hypothetical protein